MGEGESSWEGDEPGGLIEAARLAVLSRADQAKLLHRRDCVLLAQLLCDAAVLDTQDGRSGEPHLPTRSSRKRTQPEITERRAGVRASAFPSADHIVAF